MAFELVAGSFINVLLERIIPHDIIAFFKTRVMDMGLVERMERSLNIICKVLNDAEDKQINCQLITNWLDKLKDAAYLADDLLSEFHYEVTRSKVEAEQHTGKKRKFDIFNAFGKGDSSKGVKFSESQQERMKEIVNRLERLVELKDDLGLKDDGKIYSLPTRQPSSSLVKEDDVLGRNEDKEEIMRLLQVNDERSEIGVIRIVGMGGIGKTTLAQLVYGDSKTEELFKLRAWVCVSDNYDGFRVKGDILKEISKSGAERIDHLTTNSIDEELKKALEGKKFLVVLDDMWHDNLIDWDRLLAPFKWGANGSKIIVTTRDLTVASTVSVSTHHYSLSNLEEEYCWKLFEKHAFNGENLDQKFVNTGREIVKKCQGSPLALKMLGNQLRGEQLREWDRILKNNVWASQNDNVLSALMLSYRRLSPRLKRCFSHLAIFPKDYKMSKKQIIRLWVVEGFLVGNEGGREMEELGEKCLNDLVSRSFLEETVYGWNNKRRFCMHDLINDLAKRISGKFVARMEVDSSSQISPSNRHLSYLVGTMDMSLIKEAISKSQSLRTFLIFRSDWKFASQMEVPELLRDRISEKLSLRVLSLRGVKNVVHLLGNLKYLQYLDLSETNLKLLPESVCTLYNLQILILYRCRKLVELHMNLRRSINLCCLDLRDTPRLKGMPEGMGNLKELRSLPKFSVGIQNCAKLDDLVELQHLQQELRIDNLQNVMETPRDVLMNKENLEDLYLVWENETADLQYVSSEHESDETPDSEHESDETTDSEHESDETPDSEHESVLEKLKPCTSIKRLLIRGYGGRKFADWVGDSSYSNIVSISLKGCKYCTVLPTLGQLLFLENLSIEGFDAVSNVGVEFCKSSSVSMEVPFSSLKTLDIEDMRQWEDWVICDSVNCEWFPKLEDLTICNCPKLKSISTCEPTHKIFKSLHQIFVLHCPNLKISDLLTVSSFKELEMIGDDRQVCVKKLPSEMYYLEIWQGDESSGERNCNPRIEGNEEMMIVFNALCFERIEISDNDFLQSIPLEALPFLRSLYVCSCNKLESLSASEDPHHLPLHASLEVKLCPNLTSLVLHDCSNLRSLPQYMHNHFQSLEHLEIRSCEKIESFPGGGLPANLKSLVVCDCDKLESLPEGGLPSSLSDLVISGCPLLEKRCERDKGEDWHKISHISTIKTNLETI